ncbi:hypothetical protein GCM10022251_14330 [Phytohabitans flavus]
MHLSTVVTDLFHNGDLSYRDVRGGPDRCSRGLTLRVPQPAAGLEKGRRRPEDLLDLVDYLPPGSRKHASDRGTQLSLWAQRNTTICRKAPGRSAEFGRFRSA